MFASVTRSGLPYREVEGTAKLRALDEYRLTGIRPGGPYLERTFGIWEASDPTTWGPESPAHIDWTAFPERPQLRVMTSAKQRLIDLMVRCGSERSTAEDIVVDFTHAQVEYVLPHYERLAASESARDAMTSNVRRKLW
jgi:hypothetical protein